jgi:AraC-like DNA-binding protein
MQYLSGWRMQLARRLLSESPLGLAEIAARVGYESEAAFNRAFRRVVGTPPASWRQARVSARRIEQEDFEVSAQGAMFQHDARPRELVRTL